MRVFFTLDKAKRFVPVLFVCFLAACGGSDTGAGPGSGGDGGTDAGPGSGGDDGTTPPVAISYETLASTASVTSGLAGSAIRSSGTGTYDVVVSSGSVTHNTGATSLSDGTYSLSDPDGATNDILSDGTSSIALNGVQGFSGTYDYTQLYTQTYTANSTTYDLIGVYGIVTDSADVPTSGNATYSGEARAVIVTASEGYDLSSGSSTIAVDFGSGSANMTLNNFTVGDLGSGTNAPFDTIAVTNMSVSGNSISGGTVSTENAGSAVNVTGPNTVSNVNGHFYGYDSSNSIPDEVGGNVLLVGDSGRVLGTFVAD